MLSAKHNGKRRHAWNGQPDGPRATCSITTMPMRLIKAIRTPWAPYALTFSRDGTRLAFGGESWYGHGGITVLRLEDGRIESLDWATVPWVVAGGIHSVVSAPSGVPSIERTGPDVSPTRRQLCHGNGSVGNS